MGLLRGKLPAWDKSGAAAGHSLEWAGDTHVWTELTLLPCGKLTREARNVNARAGLSGDKLCSWREWEQQVEAHLEPVSL